MSDSALNSPPDLVPEHSPADAASSLTDTDLTEDDLVHWLALRVTPGLGTRSALKLIERFRTPQAIFRASQTELEGSGITAGLAASIASGCSFDDAVTQHQKLVSAGATLIPITHPLYPAPLKDIFDAPPMLFTRGRIQLLDRLAIGVVGTRRPTTYGTAAVSKLAKDLSEAGLVIASGMARGIDTAAHKAALEAGGDTIAVFGCGVDEVYPAENRKLAERIAENGLVLSDFPMGTPPYPQNFPMRNRIVSGISLGILVVEGGEYSGSAITARLATEQNREVFAVPGNITSKLSWGPNLLIKQGGKLVQTWNDVVSELKPEHRRRLLDETRKQLYLNEQGQQQDSGKDPAAASANDPRLGPMAIPAREIMNVLQADQPIPMDTLLETVPHISASEVMAALFELELEGIIRQLPGKHFVRVWQE